MRESDIEKYLVKRVKEAGGEVRKVRWIGRTGAPDRVVMGLRKAATIWVELKATGKTPEPHQEREHKRMRTARQTVSVLDSFAAVDQFMAVWHG